MLANLIEDSLIAVEAVAMQAKSPEERRPGSEELLRRARVSMPLN